MQVEILPINYFSVSQSLLNKQKIIIFNLLIYADSITGYIKISKDKIFSEEEEEGRKNSLIKGCTVFFFNDKV